MNCTHLRTVCGRCGKVLVECEHLIDKRVEMVVCLDCQPDTDLLGPVLDAVPERADREGDSQSLPVINDRPDIQSQVIADIAARRQVGIKRYGTALQPHNGRNALLDAYEEALDLAMYLKQRLVEDGR